MLGNTPRAGYIQPDHEDIADGRQYVTLLVLLNILLGYLCKRHSQSSTQAAIAKPIIRRARSCIWGNKERETGLNDVRARKEEEKGY